MSKVYIVVEVHDSPYPEEQYERNLAVYLDEEKANNACWNQKMCTDPIFDYRVEEYEVIE